MTLLTRFDRWDPFDELTTLRNRMDRLWPRMSAPQTAALANWVPTSDVIETKDEIIFKTELPGIEEKDVDVEIENGMLLIQGERKAESESEDKGYRRVERSYGSFFRSFALPPNVEAEKISANFGNGLLEVHVPKTDEVKPHAVKIEVRKQVEPPAQKAQMTDKPQPAEKPVAEKPQPEQQAR